MYSKIVNTILVFFIVFAVRLPVVHNSTVLAALIIVLTRPSSLFSIRLILRQKYVQKIIKYILLIMFLSVFVTLYNQTLELSIMRSLINQLFIFATVILFYASLDKKTSLDSMHWYLLNAYVLQSIIILLAYNFSVVQDFVYLFQPEEIVETATEGYDGFRALSLSGGSFFWVSSAYTMIFLIAVYKLLERKNNFWNGIAFFIIVIGSLFTGRTVFVGLAICLGLFFINSNYKTIIKPLVFTVLIVFSLLAVLPPSFFDSGFALWAFELFNTFNETGTLESSSTNELTESIFIPSLKTIFLGDGLWLGYNANGSPYYGGSDSGYLRVILFYGIGGLLVYFMFARHVIFGLSKSPALNNKLGKTFMYFFMLLQLVLNIKGQSMSYTTSTQGILFVFFMSFLIVQINKEKKMF